MCSWKACWRRRRSRLNRRSAVRLASATDQCGDHNGSPGRLVATAAETGMDACSERGWLSILVTCWNCGRIANAATGTSTRHPRTCLCARTSAPGAATARRTSCTASARIVAANSSGAPSARPACLPSTRHRRSGLSGPDAAADPRTGKQKVLPGTSAGKPCSRSRRPDQQRGQIRDGPLSILGLSRRGRAG